MAAVPAGSGRSFIRNACACACACACDVLPSSGDGSTRRSSASRRCTLGGCGDLAVDEGPHQDRCSGRVRRRGPGDDHRRRRDLDDLACHPVLLGCARKTAPASVHDPRGHPPGAQDPHRGDEPEGVQVAVLRDRPQPPFSCTASGRWGRNRRRGTRDPAPGWRSRIAARGSSARCIAIMARICYHRSLGKTGEMTQEAPCMVKCCRPSRERARLGARCGGWTRALSHVELGGEAGR